MLDILLYQALKSTVWDHFQTNNTLGTTEKLHSVELAIDSRAQNTWFTSSSGNQCADCSEIYILIGIPGCHVHWRSSNKEMPYKLSIYTSHIEKWGNEDCLEVMLACFPLSCFSTSTVTSTGGNGHYIPKLQCFCSTWNSLESGFSRLWDVGFVTLLGHILSLLSSLRIQCVVIRSYQ